ncbi:unnamed protein product [Prorocentrum cordatum]|uniref:Cytosolic Fe-S cluster assembly factor NARFL n=1 Tax=Prorocentrum cordatum TaxID=2364126 RepID=A0ABN9VBZ2_9DINO|nr:unnamed protein product [Polarella glacialis]
MSFSGGVKLGDLDDFIAASQECVKPLIEAASGNGSAKIGSTGTVGAAALGTRIAAVETPQVQRPNLIKTKQSKEDPKAQIAGVTLSDCLACSGCVTSAETVLLQAQSGEEFLRRVAEVKLMVTATILHWVQMMDYARALLLVVLSVRNTVANFVLAHLAVVDTPRSAGDAAAGREGQVRSLGGDVRDDLGASNVVYTFGLPSQPRSFCKRTWRRAKKGARRRELRVATFNSSGWPQLRDFLETMGAQLGVVLCSGGQA